MDDLFNMQYPISKKDKNDLIFNNLIEELNNSRQILKNEMDKLLDNYEQNNKMIVNKYIKLYNNNN
tara:strand:+ start:473 stop:670 length:198 start_codon:yes stop_codon:yes gene_type:complete